MAPPACLGTVRRILEIPADACESGSFPARPTNLNTCPPKRPQVGGHVLQAPSGAVVVARHFWANSAALATSSAKTYLFQKSPDHQCQLGFQLVECCPTATLFRRESECLHSPSLREARRIPTHELLQPSMSQYVGPAKFVTQSPFGYDLRFQTAAFGYPWHGLFVRVALARFTCEGTHTF